MSALSRDAHAAFIDPQSPIKVVERQCQRAIDIFAIANIAAMGSVGSVWQRVRAPRPTGIARQQYDTSAFMAKTLAMASPIPMEPRHDTTFPAMSMAPLYRVSAASQCRQFPVPSSRLSGTDVCFF